MDGVSTSIEAELRDERRKSPDRISVLAETHIWLKPIFLYSMFYISQQLPLILLKLSQVDFLKLKES